MPTQGRSAYFTIGMSLTLLAVALGSASVLGKLPDEILGWIGFATRHLRSGEWDRLVTSALFTHGGWTFWRSWTALTVLLFLTERLLGPWRTAMVFWGGHLATLLLLSLILIFPLHAAGHDLGSLLYRTNDVGPSAGYYTCLGVLVGRLARRHRVALASAAVLAWLGVGAVWHAARIPVAAVGIVADLAHLLAFALGLTFNWFVMRRRNCFAVIESSAHSP